MRATCRWCLWSSEDYNSRDDEAKESAFELQRLHVALEHPEEYELLQDYLDGRGKK